MSEQQVTAAHSQTPKAKTTHGIGVVPGNPSKCILCLQKIQPGQRWVTVSKGEYKIIRHATCR